MLRLHYDYYSQGEKTEFVGHSTLSNAALESVPIIIIPGFLGSATNWRSFAKGLSQHYEVCVIDQRNHGRSPHADSHSYADMVADLDHFITEKKWAKVILCGHSMGGKVAMLYSQQYASKVAQLIVLDIAPVRYAHNPAPFLEALARLDIAQLQTRRDAETALSAIIDDAPTRLFVSMSLEKVEDGFRWKINVPILRVYLAEVSDYPKYEQASAEYQGKSIFINGARSEYVKPSMHSIILGLFPKAQFVTIEHAGHWLHVEQAQNIIAQICEFLDADDEVTY